MLAVIRSSAKVQGVLCIVLGMIVLGFALDVFLVRAP